MAQRKKKATRKKTASKQTRRKPASRRKASPAPGADDGPPPSDPLTMSEAELERMLDSGENDALLREALGEELVQELRDLRREDTRRSLRGAPRVLVLPGIMGSKLGYAGRVWNDYIWIELLDIAKGNLRHLRLPPRGRERIQPLGVFASFYYLLKLRLRRAGFDADSFAFDWRLSIPKLGRLLAREIRNDGADEIHLVAHSMGGLVSRAALLDERAAGKIVRVVQLGTPNQGSYAPVQALTGTHDTVAKFAWIDQAHDVRALTGQVFGTFPGLAEMLPFPGGGEHPDFFDPQSWPADWRPAASLLSAAKRQRATLPDPDDRFRLIAGVDQETIVHGETRDGAVIYRKSTAGDGTVPLDFARMPGLRTWYCAGSHGMLPNYREVADATADLLRTGSTQRLPDRYQPTSARSAAQAPSTEPPFGGRRHLREISRAELRAILEPFARPATAAVLRTQDASDTATTTPHPVVGGRADYAAPWRGIQIGRAQKHRLEIQLALGSIVDINAQAYVLGTFRGVRPDGAAAAIDVAMDHAMSDFVNRQMFSCETGELFTIPASRMTFPASYILLAGLGNFASFSYETLRLVSENVVRAATHTNIEDFATVLVGGNCGLSVQETVESMVAGFVAGMQDTRGRHGPHRITFCEIDKERYARLRDALLRLSVTPLLDDVEICVTELPPRPPTRHVSRREGEVDTPEPTRYLYLEESVDASLGSVEDPGHVATAPASIRFRVSLLDTERKATILYDEIQIDPKALTKTLAPARRPDQLTPLRLRDMGRELASLVLPERIRTALGAESEAALVVIHDRPTSRVPWETLDLGSGTDASPPLSLRVGMARRYVARELSASKWLARRRLDRDLTVLLVIDPTEDLEGARQEGELVRRLLADHERIRVTVRRHGEASRNQLMKDLGSGAFDVIHYAGHAFFDPQRPEESGLLCAGRQTLSGRDLATLPNAPALMFCNACESARVRAVNKSQPADAPTAEHQLTRHTSFAEAILRGGVAQYVGTYWPVSDVGAKRFAETFYTSVLAGRPVGDAVDAGRRALHEHGEIDWANYLHYGPREFRLKVVG